jgi:membrane protease YdiL (CAAX protease family)
VTRSPAGWWPARLLAKPWSLTIGLLTIATLGLGAALLVPIAFSDPNGVDPYLARLSATSVLLVAAGFLIKRLSPARPVLLALVAVAGSYTLLSAGPAIIQHLFGTRAPGYTTQVFIASVVQVLATVLVVVVAQRALPAGLRPDTRLQRFGIRAVAVAVAGVVLLLLAGLALPAQLLGRLGLQPVEIARDLPWLAPACALQAFSQEVQFRGLLMGALERTMTPGWANIAQAVVFGLSHLAIAYGGPLAPFVPVTFVVGLALGWLVQRTNSLWTAVIIHAVADIALTATVLSGLYGLN